MVVLWLINEFLCMIFFVTVLMCRSLAGVLSLIYCLITSYLQSDFLSMHMREPLRGLHHDIVVLLV